MPDAKQPIASLPREAEHNGTDGEDLAPEDLGRVHGDGRSGGHRTNLAARITARRVLENWSERIGLFICRYRPKAGLTCRRSLSSELRD